MRTPYAECDQDVLYTSHDHRSDTYCRPLRWPSGENLGTQNYDHDCSREHGESSFETVADLYSIEEPESPILLSTVAATISSITPPTTGSNASALLIPNYLDDGGGTPQELADDLGITTSTLHEHLHRAEQKLLDLS